MKGVQDGAILAYGALWGLALAPVILSYVPRALDMYLIALSMCAAIGAAVAYRTGSDYCPYLTGVFTSIAVGAFTLGNYVNRVHDDPEERKSPEEEDRLLGHLKPPKREKKNYKAMNFIRYMASIHIVLGHYYGPGFGTKIFGEDPNIEMSHWGHTGVTFFFLLSGFVLTYTHMIKNEWFLPPPFVYLMKRFGAFFPTHLVALSIILAFSTEASKPEGWQGVSYFGDGVKFPGVFVSIFLLDGLFPNLLSYRVNGVTWFLSCMIIFSLLFPFLYYNIRRLPKKFVWVLLAVCYVMAYVPQLYVWTLPVDERKFGGTIFVWYNNDWTCFINVFVSGMCIGRLFVDRKKDELPLPLQYGVTIGVVCLVAFFIVTIHLGYEPKDFAKTFGAVSFRHGALLPLHAMVILGATSDKDPLTKLFCTKPFLKIGELSFAMYIMQAPVYQIALELYSMGADAPWYRQLLIMYYPTLLLPITAVTHHFIGKPGVQLWRKYVC